MDSPRPLACVPVFLNADDSAPARTFGRWVYLNVKYEETKYSMESVGDIEPASTSLELCYTDR